MHSTQVELSLKTYMARYKKQYILDSTCWLVVSDSSVEKLRDEISQKVGREDIVFVAEIASELAFSMHSNPLARWLPRTLAALD